MNRRIVPSEIGFADGSIESYEKQDDVVRVIVTAWNERKICVTFSGVVRLLDGGSGDIDVLCEIEGRTDFLQAAIDYLYDVPPASIPYRHFQFLGVDGDGILDVVCEQVETAILER